MTIPVPTIDQSNIIVAAQSLLDALDDTVPANVAHYAVEDARRVAKQLIRVAATIHTNDTKESK
jgi:hypothetical protein